MRRAFTWLPWVLLILVIISFLTWQKLHQPKPTVAADGVKMPAEKVEPLIDTTRTGGVVSYSAAVKVAAPAVVNIFTTQKVKQMNHPLLNDPVFREFFGNQIPQQPQNENSLGSGVIVRADGYILTNNHVIAQAEHIVVALHDGRRAEAKVIGTDPDTDLAVIKIELDKLPVLPFKLSGNEVGDVVLAIGNPFGVGQTVTQGIISATGRSDLGINTYEDFIQTDAAINPGNSGGALIDVAGNLIGVNTAIFSQSGGSLGIGFAIPAQVCQQVLNSILKDGRVVRGWLGISLIPNTLDEDVLASKPVGVIVADVLRDGPADAAGVKRGDKIIQVNNEQIGSASHLINYVALQAPASVIDVVVERDGKQQTLQVKVGERKVQQNAQSQYIPLPKRQ
ncbi:MULTISPECIES: trypsin-like peptidase domain-containing protein [Acinetobacter]|uniref:Trypsin-like peptidase domain-containing protein n=1 Tax=Acinetobacter thutiue TaxID=2998078 RepID=A0ABT7WJ29_9GAMM|nr:MULTISPECIES: trypsin-like peptidase domain-containing protein [Acinetobacter]MCY6410585.1 trypsin-like peptidase domain-containing protein [Acinetobacter thutiue]MDH0031324.1 trypsin-like peptidase domain-containing protein [Acinetobacter sp. GD04021]MDH0887069.1 trypsin-like peptidase domain-containing protein [Acinetobacter sp. GD03873]MDH1083520.1 trypsin-like peptidase domain-containing protein [Acinetobacter sp. GD03983]MDH2190385.1 trypsin-like peptidase domain-containing protein [Ac